jgi:hypothetical protein
MVYPSRTPIRHIGRMRTGSEYMVTILMTAIAGATVAAAYSWQRGTAPDVERLAGRLWADVAHEDFKDCPRGNGMRFWMGCTDTAPKPKRNHR